METKNISKGCGSIVKRELLVPVGYNILAGTFVAEVKEPYSEYYGKFPQKSVPNSLFLFTAHYYSLAEVLRFAQNIDSCYMKKVNVATATLEFSYHKYFAIRVKFFRDYEHIQLLQKCCIQQGIKFTSNVQMTELANVEVSKCFVLEELVDGVYIDKIEGHRGYITIPRQITQDEFSEILIEIRNNTDCELFDAAMANIIIDLKTIDMVRIYSENINLGQLKCIKDHFEKYIMKKARHTEKIKHEIDN